MRLDLADLRLFLAVVEAGSITGGAAACHLALASASERLRRIEADAGVALLGRRPRGIVATEAGEALAHHARRMLRQRALLENELRDFAAGRHGTLHLYANTAALTHFLPPRLAPWLAAHPRLRVELKERTSAQIVQSIVAGLVDAGIVSDAVDPGGLRMQPLADDHLHLIVPVGHRFASRRRIGLAEALSEPFVGLNAGSALQQHVEANARAARREPSIRIRMETFEGLCDMVSHGVGVAIVPAAIATALRRRHRHRAIALTDGWARRRLCLCHRGWRSLSPALRSLFAHLGGGPDPASSD